MIYSWWRRSEKREERRNSILLNINLLLLVQCIDHLLPWNSQYPLKLWPLLFWLPYCITLSRNPLFQPNSRMVETRGFSNFFFLSCHPKQGRKATGNTGRYFYILSWPHFDCVICATAATKGCPLTQIPSIPPHHLVLVAKDKKSRDKIAINPIRKKNNNIANRLSSCQIEDANKTPMTAIVFCRKVMSYLYIFAPIIIPICLLLDRCRNAGTIRGAPWLLLYWLDPAHAFEFIVIFLCHHNYTSASTQTLATVLVLDRFFYSSLSGKNKLQ